MTNKISFFKMHESPRFLNYSITKSNLDQVVIDWLRDSTQDGLLNINGVDVKNIIKNRYNGNEFTPSTFFDMMSNEIMLRLNLDPISAEATIILKHLMNVLHQGASLHMMQTALCEEATKNGYLVSPQDVVAHVNIEVKQGAIYILEDVNVKKLRNSNDPEVTIMAHDEKMPVVFASATQKIALGSRDNIQHTLEASSVTYGSEEAKKVIDQRNLLQRIYDYIKNLLNLNIEIKTYSRTL